MGKTNGAINYTAPNGWSGVLFFKYEFEGRKYYHISIRDPAGRERLHKWNSCPNNLEGLKRVVDRESERMERKEKEGEAHE